MKYSEFDSVRDGPALAGKVVLVTGGTRGLGRRLVLTLASLPSPPAALFFTGRSAADATTLVEEYARLAGGRSEASFLRADFASLASVRDAAAAFLSARGSAGGSLVTLDALVCNAGVMAVPPGLTTDGYEVHFGVCHMAHALLIKLLLPALEAAAGRVVLVSSTGMLFASLCGGVDPDALRDAGVPWWLGNTAMGKYARYGRAKLANAMYARQLAARHPGLLSLSVHPGVIYTGLVTSLGFWDRLPVDVLGYTMEVSEEDGVKNHVWALGARKEDVVNGGFYEPVGAPGTWMPHLGDEAMGARLWDWTQKELEGHSL